MLQNSDLHAGPDQHPVTELVIGYSGRVITGLQMRYPAERCSQAMDAAGNAPLALRKSIDQGMTPNNAGSACSTWKFTNRMCLQTKCSPSSSMRRRYSSSLARDTFLSILSVQGSRGMHRPQLRFPVQLVCL